MYSQEQMALQKAKILHHYLFESMLAKNSEGPLLIIVKLWG